jgi:hypothetical protein
VLYGKLKSMSPYFIIEDASTTTAILFLLLLVNRRRKQSHKHFTRLIKITEKYEAEILWTDTQNTLVSVACTA